MVLTVALMRADVPVPIRPAPTDPDPTSRSKPMTCAFHVHIARFIADHVRQRR